MDSIKEIHVNGRVTRELLHLFERQTIPWRSLDDSITLTIYLNSVCTLSSFGFQFWAMCHADSVRISYGSMRATDACEWTTFDSKSVTVSSRVINRTVEVVCAGVSCDRILVEMSGGHLDEFFHRYRIGIKRMYLEANPAALDPQGATTEYHVAEEVATPVIEPSKRTIRRSARRDPLFIFPDAMEVMAALYQTRVSPWQLLSAKSRHKEKLRERYPVSSVERYILPHLWTATHASLPSRSDILAQAKRNLSDSA